MPQNHGFDGLQVVYGDAGLEPVPGHHSYFRHSWRPQLVKNEQAAKPRKICGLRVTTFWLVCVIAILIIGGAVAGGVGASLAIKKSSDLDTTPTKTSSIPTSSSTSSSSTTQPSTSGSSTSSTQTSTTSSATPSNICPSANGTTYTESLGSFKYQIVCNSDFGGSGKETLSSTVLSSFSDCLSMCNTMNYFQDRADVGCTYNVEGTGEQTPGTCWCLGGNKTIVSNTGNVIAVPQ
ncbi:hypothetical protein UA08_06499 [Talaromyces atroroseus]|uniref:Apple domain-containing protein n=1 Tax=Talaromyces atroroseus TaxID=1441469 RepID=A0A225AAS9_TALAT|nr:hypothetical protein UA08_06499 [Talaromyces atroroseus]OKL57992.1 hypothetical protein UA08_06499 [Talaromyces atroroseus]